ncbi:ABC transporter permease [Christiangramia flava]|uniref:ABC transporter, permease protein n=1 Tax=Christiangramia flava JLT2011 TaxID=1229726 RepID=A0A1L7I6C9_9FLAO|nr:FtsX-like permease family protein [Christiangramia flava]APU69150.1 ABC transporter, permease protein [Christiangramia flava JLT2011]OSS38249.1 ABC transporter, permease protein [Christiangramia flava JLT2011]
MNFEYFVVKRLISTKKYKSSISAPIIKIAITAIAIGVVMMLVSFATGLGLQEKIRDKIAAFNGHISISSFDNNNSKVTLMPVSKEQDFYPEFQSVSGIRHVQAVATKFAVIRTETDFEGVVVKGVGEDYDWNYFKDFIVQGEIPDFSGKLNDEVLISEYLANRLNLKLGDRINTFFMRSDSDRPLQRGFRVAGIYDSGFQEFDELYVIADIRHIQRINKWDDNQVGAFEVFVDNFDEIDQKGNEIYENTSSLLDTQTISQKYYSIFEWLSLFDFNIALIIGIMILVAGINMITALLVLILERTQMIGIFKALGAADWSIRKIFLFNAGYLIILGLFWGNLIGLGLLLAQKYFKLVPLDPRTYYVTEVPIYLNWDYILFVNIGTLLLCMLMLLVPSIIISRISPVKAIKFD